MDRSYASGAAGSAPSVPASPSNGYPTAGNPGTGTPATKPGPYWYHMITEELMAIITAGGITPAPGTLNQVKQALDTLYAPKGSGSFKIQPVGASVASNALTVTLNPTALDFRSATLSSGVVNSRTVGSAISLAVPSGATLGTTSGIASRILILAIDNAGTVELAVYNAAGSANLDEAGVISTTAISAASNSLTVYSQTARTNVPYRIVGYVDSTQATAGTWSSAPTAVQGIGGQALAAMASIGYGQSWQSVTRSLGTTYYNTTGKPIFASYQATYSLNSAASWTINGVSGIGYTSNANTNPQAVSSWAIIPPGASYSYNISSGTVTGLTAVELR